MKLEIISFSPFLNFFMVKLIKNSIFKRLSFSPFLNFFMVKLIKNSIFKRLSFSPFLNFFMVKFKWICNARYLVLVPF
ncbi:Uncharacterised protein [Campylobacter jejuni subsp. doylei]|nr:Uncharacterised protein [Campylobacter jejuni subsp. doylei]